MSPTNIWNTLYFLHTHQWLIVNIILFIYYYEFWLKHYCEIKMIVPVALLKDKRPILIWESL